MHRKDIHRIALVWDAAIAGVAILVNAVIAQSPPDGGGPSGAAEEEEGVTGQTLGNNYWDCIANGFLPDYCAVMFPPTSTPTAVPPTPTPPPPPPPPPPAEPTASLAPAPSGFRVTSTTQNSVSLRWNSVTNAHRYRLEYRRSSRSSLNTFKWSSYIQTGTSRTIRLSKCTTYSFRVRARGNGSPYSTDWGSESSLSRKTLCSTNIPPTITAGPTAVSYAENGTATVATYTANDPDGVNSSMTWSLEGSDKSKFGITSSGSLTFKTSPDYESPADSGRNNVYNVTVKVTDSGSPRKSATRNVAVTVTNVNEPTTITSGSSAVNYAENGTATVATYAANDPEGDGIKWSLTGSDSSQFNIRSGTLTFGTSPDYESPADSDGDNVYNVTVRVTDNKNPAGNADPRIDDTIAVTVSVTDVNEPPPPPPGRGPGPAPPVNSAPSFTGSATTRSVAENTAARRNVGAAVSATDADGDTLTYSISRTDASSFTVNSSTGQIRTSVALDYENPRDSDRNNAYNVTVSVTDNKNSAGNTDPSIDDTIAVTINVTNVNERPRTQNTIPNQTLTKGGSAATINLSDKFQDPDARDTLKYAATSKYTSVATTGVTGSRLSIAPVNVGTTQVTVTASDRRRLSVSQSFTVRVNPTVPGQVSTPSVTAGDGQLQVSWDAPSNGGSAITRYDVQHKRTSVSWPSGSGANNGTNRNRTITGLTNGVSYHVRVRACNTTGCGSWSNPVVGTPITSITVPGRVSAPSVTAGDRQLQVSWDAPSNGGSAITRYDVQHKRTSVSWPSGSGANNGTNRNRTITGLTNGSSYHVRVRACNAAGCGSWSNSVSGTPRTTPGQVSAPRVTAGDRQLQVSWDAPSTTGGSAITRYEVQHKLTSVSWPSGSGANNGTSSNRTIMGLTNGLSYHVRVRACNVAGCGSWSDDSEIFLLAKPVLDVSPLPQRKAKLTWKAVTVPSTDAVEYVVQMRKFNDVTWTTAQSSSLVFTASSVSHPINLDAILVESPQNARKGLAHNSAYDFRVKAVRKNSSGDVVQSIFSDTITIIDTPIYGVDGHNSSRTSGNAAQAVIKWKTPTPSAASESYKIRYRELRPSTNGREHTSPDWSPGNYALSTTVSISEDSLHHRITGLITGKVYAVQLMYEETVTRNKVYAARDAYVWVSTDFPANGSRVATYPFFGHWPGREYEYIICTDTFPDNPTTTPGVNEREQWVSLIVDAFEQWEEATNGFVTMTRNERWTCSDADSTNMEQFILNDDGLNEVRMVDTEADAGGQSAYSFSEFTSDAFRFCIVQSPACVTPFSGYSGIRSDNNRQAIADLVQEYNDGEISGSEMIDRIRDSIGPSNPRVNPGASNVLQDVDVSFRQDAFDSMRIQTPDTTRFNTCIMRSGVHYADNLKANDYFAYATALHEAGHALGLSNIAPDLVSTQSYRAAHPTIADAVMNHDGEVGETTFSEPDCSPYPFDLMAIYALYQSATTPAPTVDIPAPFTGQTVTMTASTSDSPTSYQWQERSGSSWTNLGEASDSPQYTVTSSTRAVRVFRVGTTYRSGATLNSAPVAISWRPITVIVEASPDYPESGDATKRTVTLTATADAPDGATYYQWQRWQQASGSTWMNLGPLTTSNTTSVSFTTRGTRKFRVVVSHATASSVESDPVYVTWDEWAIVDEMLTALQTAVTADASYITAQTALVNCVNRASPPPSPLFTSFDDILSRYTGATKTKMDTGGDCATQATTMFTTVQTLSRSKLATIKSGNAVYAALLETPRGQYLEANVGDPSTTRIVAYLKATTLPLGELEDPLYVPQSAGAAGQSVPTAPTPPLVPPIPLGTGLGCLPEGVDGNNLTIENKLKVLNCLVFSTSHSFWVARSLETRDDNAFTRDDRWKDIKWFNYGDWQCSGLVGTELNGPVPSCLKHDVGYSTKRIAGVATDPEWNTELDEAWNPRNKALADLKLKADIEKYGCQNPSPAAASGVCHIPESGIAFLYHWWLADVQHLGWPITQADVDHIDPTTDSQYATP